MRISNTPSESATNIEAEEQVSPIMTGATKALLHSAPDTVSSCPVTRAKAALSVNLLHCENHSFEPAV